jgi:hypothetical protein
MKRALRVILRNYMVGVIVLGTSLLFSHYRIGLFHSPADFLRLAIRDFGLAAFWPILLVAVVLSEAGLIGPME